MSSQADKLASHRIVIGPSKGWVPLDLKELWQYRELLMVLTWRTVSIRYKQTVLGAAWAILQPLFTMVVFSIFFGNLAKVPSDGLPYPIFAYTALLPWQFFSQGLGQAGNSVVSSQNLVTKVYFPRMIIPISAILPGLIDFALAFVILIGMMAYFHIAPTLMVLTLPLFLLLALAASLGVGLWLAAMNVRYRDIRLALPFLTQLWMFVTPVAYPSSLVPERYRVIYGLNPMSGVTEGFRWALLGKGEPPGPMLMVSVAAVAILLVSGLYYFRRAERNFADVI